MRSTIPAALLLSMVVALSACTTAQLRMPEGFGANAVAFDVSGHSPRKFNQPVRFGPYGAVALREGSTFSWRIPLAGLDLGRTSRAYAYTMEADGLPPVEVQCRAQAWTAGAGNAASRTTVDLTGAAGPLLACGLRAQGQAALPLEVERQGRQLRGRLSTPWQREYAIRALDGYAGSSLAAMEPTGYAIVDGGTTLAVVDVLNGGRVHLDRSIDDGQRAYLAASAAALLLLDPALGE